MDDISGRVNGCPHSTKIKVESESDDSDTDPIVKEIPVFLSKSLAEQLYLFQVWISFVLSS